MELGRDSDTGGQVIFNSICFSFDAFSVVSFRFSGHIVSLFIVIRQFFYILV